MLTEDTIRQIFSDYHVEELHARQVAALADSLLRRTRKALQSSAADRDVLRLASLFHDIAYASDPVNHETAAVDILQGLDLPGLDVATRNLIAGIVLLHRKDWEAALDHPVFASADARERALRLGAVLRLADGLDHGHIQDSAVTSVRVEAGTVHVTIEGVAYRGNIASARRKTDLWMHAFGRDLHFLDGPSKPWTTRYDGVIKPGRSLWEGACRWLFFEYRIMGDMIERMLDAEDTDPVHNFRVSLRRFRSGLRMFRRPLRDTTAAAVNRDLASLADALGPVRDVDVKWEILRDPALTGRFGSDPSWPRLTGQIADDRAALRGLVRDTVGDPAVGDLMHRIARLLRVEIPDKMRDGDDTAFAEYARKQIARTVRTIRAAGPPGKAMPVEQMHDMRKRCRRGRYWAESTIPDRGEPARKRARQLKALTDQLGAWRDCDALADFLTGHPADQPDGLMDELHARRRSARKSAKVLWKRLKKGTLEKPAAEKQVVAERGVG